MRLGASAFFVTFYLCAALQTQTCAQTDEIVSRHYTMKDGLPADAINRIIQDRQGFIWLATYSGLSKFDGYKFTTYRNNPYSSNSLASNMVSDLWEDGLGRLWVGHSQGLDVFDPRNEMFTFHWPDSERKEKSNISTLRLRERKDGKIWVCTTDGVYLGDPQTTSIKKFTKLPDHLWIWDITESQDGSIWTAAAKLGVFRLDAETGKTTRYGYDPKKFQKPGVFI